MTMMMTSSSQAIYFLLAIIMYYYAYLWEEQNQLWEEKGNWPSQLRQQGLEKKDGNIK